jgi:hypothetical protein
MSYCLVHSVCLTACLLDIATGNQLNHVCPLSASMQPLLSSSGISMRLGCTVIVPSGTFYL